MEWISVAHGEKLPDIEVLAGNFKPRTYGYKEILVGYIRYDSNANRFVCEDEYQRLEGVTHYIIPQPPNHQEQ